MPKSVLIVEDDFIIAWDLQQVMEALGWVVVGPAPTVKASLLLLETETPSVAMLDMNLGRELVTPVADELKRSGIPFFLASACKDAVALGGSVFEGVTNVGKPLNERLLSSTLERLVAEG
jgi:DNA-binding NtrC family response regulator